LLISHVPLFFFHEQHLGDKTLAGASRRLLCPLSMTNGKISGK
jgi:hypothetical protein